MSLRLSNRHPVTACLQRLPIDVRTEIERIAAQAAGDSSIVLTGSLIEGFGNTHSDVDVYLIMDEGRQRESVAIGMRRHRYVDCEYFAIGSLIRLANRFSSAGWKEVPSLRDAEIDRYYRLAAGVCLSATPAFAAIEKLFQTGIACELLGKVATLRALELLGGAALAIADGNERGAALTLRDAAFWTGTAELAQGGEGYPSLKWLGEKAARRYGRESPDFTRIVGESLRPHGSVGQRLERLRQRVTLEPGLLALTAARQCALADGVRVLSAPEGWLLIDQHRGVVAQGGRLGHLAAALAQGKSWTDAMMAVSDTTAVAPHEVNAALWRQSSRLRTSGHFTEVKAS